MSGLKIAVNQNDMAVRLARAEAELAAERAKVDLLQRHLDDVRRMLPPPDAKASYSSHQVAFRRVMVEDDTSAHHQLSGITRCRRTDLLFVHGTSGPAMMVPFGSDT